MAQSALYIVGIGPGGLNHMTFEAREALASSDVIVGYKTYLDFITPLLAGKEVVSSGMLKEVERCNQALSIACSGKSVALVSSGDAGVYGMAGLALELAENLPAPPDIIIIPGVSAVQAAAAVLGAPLMHDFAVISLSDLLTPWPVIEKRVAAAAAADFVIALYNPKSKGRTMQIEAAQAIIAAQRAAGTPVGIVRNACREGEDMVVTTLDQMLDHDIDMFSIVIIGNSATFVDQKGRMVTPRGYKTGSRFEVLGSKLKTENLEHRTSNLEPALSRAVMICGTGSDVGKSVLTAGFCRILKKRGIGVAPFKSQNMALNSAVTPEGGEIGRAQAVQAEACGIAPHVDMNPVLLKPNSDVGSQVIVQGRVIGNMKVAEYNAYKPEAFVSVKESFSRLRQCHDFIVIEGAGSIAEINLKQHDIANLKVAEMAGCPVILVADIDRGGVFAQIVGTIELLEPAERAMVKGIIINKFRGDASLLKSGIDFVEVRTGLPVLGVIPYFQGFRIADEDSVPLESRAAASRSRHAAGDKLQIGVIRMSRMSNYTDFDALENEPDVELRYIDSPKQMKGLDLIILPGSKSTLTDLYFLMERGLYKAIREFGGAIFGICGGYQMLGRRVLDPFNVESDIKEAEGLSLLDVETVMLMQKETHQVTGHLLAEMDLADGGRELTGYEIHMGETTRGDNALPFARIKCRSDRLVDIEDGAVSRDGRIHGTYLHGIFDNAGFRTAFLNGIRRSKGLRERHKVIPIKDPYELLADHLERHLDMDRLFAICGLKSAKADR
ncbi:cobalt-precorrin-3 C17-methyltransferase and adenosylcobyric acid synthetase [Geotalea daltonii FRC-32]|uniref:Cobyric acid synthase n=1 Tax=Geotalea daltonii (strain DSM 22248 / JCM 15807 / FRC-32) TaxID=316067 RepID=B9M7V7_GEODF|nr:cobyric acid synthase [Geotalea daltonii]ACM18415.1 cobalt-precorrin-3 C17-methyltransferase and adenosylcobyric acid synthetase [Geotalea daltonii FRC-32]